MDASSVVRHAVDVARQSRTPVAFEPGRRTVILSPTAVAQLTYWMADQFVGYGDGPLLVLGAVTEKGRRSKLGMRVLDPRLIMRSDPADPDGGYMPFFERSDNELWGYPTPAKTWVDHGLLVGTAWGIGKAALRNVTPSAIPRSFRLTTVEGTTTATIDEMIANCPEGIYVNRFSPTKDIRDLAGTVMGTTRDGCFLIKRGKIVQPIVNLRFLESPFAVLNRVEMIGVPERVALGDLPRYDPLISFVPNDGLPHHPIIVPPLMIRDFNFTALAGAV